MANYRTCLNCAHDRDECATLDRIKRAIAGHGVTSIKFLCPDRAPLYRAGDRVGVSWVVPDEDGGWNRDATEETWPATVIEEVGSRFLIKVDDVPSDYETPAREFIKADRLYCKVSSSKLAKLDEPRRLVCPCGEIEGSDMAGCHDLCGDGMIRNPRPTCLRARASQ